MSGEFNGNGKSPCGGQAEEQGAGCRAADTAAERERTPEGRGVSGPSADDGTLAEVDAPYQPTAVCLRLDKLRSSALRAIRSRPRVPHPLFWSLLHSELSEIKRMKEKARLEREAWLRGESE